MSAGTVPVVRPSPTQWLLLAVGLGLVWRYAWIMDDAFVYARYADNFVRLDFGLVYNAGEYVEGFTSPLWMLWLVVLRTVGSWIDGCRRANCGCTCRWPISRATTP
jgi:hypothetical protein